MGVLGNEDKESKWERECVAQQRLRLGYWGGGGGGKHKSDNVKVWGDEPKKWGGGEKVDDGTEIRDRKKN